MAMGAVAVVTVLGLAMVDVGAAPPALGKPDAPPASGADQPESTPVVEVVGEQPQTDPSIGKGALHANWPAGDVNPAGHPVHVGRGKTEQAGTSIVRIGLPGNAKKTSLDATVRVLPPGQSRKLVGDGVVIAVQLPAGDPAQVLVDYSSFADAVGGGFGSRLHIVSLPTCGLDTPDAPQCQVQTDLESVNDPAAQVVSVVIDPGEVARAPTESPEPGATESPAVPVEPEATAPAEPDATPQADATEIGGGSRVLVPRTLFPAMLRGLPTLPTAGGSGSGTTVLLGVVAGASSGQGDYGATSMNPSSSWSAGGRTGEFTWSYPMRVPAVPDGPEPVLDLFYSSGSTDGGVSNTNNQASWVGEGFSLGSAFIERKYISCADDMAGGNNTTATGDLCWFSDPLKTGKSPYNAYLVFGPHSGPLVRVGTTEEWRLQRDDGTRVQHKVASGAEYWWVTTLDGTFAIFGLGKASTAAPNTNSVWSVPVAGNQSGEPGYASTFASSFTTQPWRWNLDYIRTPTNHTAVFYYAKETNQYRENLTTLVSYDRGGYLTKIQYGETNGQQTADTAPGSVVFTVEERCDTAVSSTCKTAAPTAATAAAWPDVPMDSVCDASYCPSAKTSPMFFSRKRLVSVATYTRNAAGTAYDTVDRWDLAYQFLKPTDGSAVSLWLSTITHTGLVGTAVALPPVKLTPIMLASSITGAAMSRPRLSVITTEAGGQTLVKYSAPECTATTVPASAIATNTTRCMPSYYSNGTSTPALQWFNKYVVTAVTDHDVLPVEASATSTAIAQDVTTTYAYAGGGAWRYNDSPFIPAAYRTWNVWRGYGLVTTKVGSGTALQTTETRYFRGMNGDKAASGTKSVTVVDSTGASWADDDWLAGQVREARVLTTTGAEDSGQVFDPWVSAATAFDGRLTARMVDVAQTRTRQKLSSGVVRQGRDTVKARDAWGQPTQSESDGDLAVSGDEQCVWTSYATPDPSVNPALVSRVAQIGTMPALCSTALSWNTALQGLAYHYDTPPNSSAVTQGLLTESLELAGSGTQRYWATMAKTTYDGWGRPTASTDALGWVTLTAYTHTTGGLLSSVTTTSPDPDGTGPGTPLTTTVTYDARTGTPIKTVDAGGHITEATIDGLGRVTAVWLPGRARTSSASITYAYTVNAAGVNAITTKTLLPDGVNYRTDVTIMDSLLRQRQTQTLGASGTGRVLSDLRYGSAGQVVITDYYYDSTSTPTASLVAPTNRTYIYSTHQLTYDFAGRVTNDSLYSKDTYQWATATTYGGDRTLVNPPQGGTPTTTVTDIFGRTTQLIQHLGPTTTSSGAATTYQYDLMGNLLKVTDAKGNVWQYTYDLQGNQITSRDPDSGSSSATFDLKGGIRTSTDARGVSLTYNYDALERSTGITGPSGVLTSTVWDTVQKGQMSSQARVVSGAQFVERVDAYDVAGRPTKMTTVIPAVSGLVDAKLAGSYTTSLTYKPDGSLATQALPAVGQLGAETLTYGYSSTGLPATMTGTMGGVTTTYVSSSTYSVDGLPTYTQLGPIAGVSEYIGRGYDLATNRLTRIYVSNGSGAQGSIDATYDPAGNITSLYTGAAGSYNGWQMQCYSYDYQRQLTAAWTPTSLACADAKSTSSLSGPAPYWDSWVIDTIGNVTSHTARTRTATSTTAYTYPASGATSVRPHAMSGATTTGTGASSGTFAYDAAGEMTSRSATAGQQTMTWDELGYLSQTSQAGAVVAKSVNDANGNRLVRQQNGATTVHAGGAEITLSGTVVSAVRYYSYQGSLIAVRTGTTDATVTALVPDQNGTVWAQVSFTTAINVRTIWRDPYGQMMRGVLSSIAWVGERGFVGGTTDSTGLTRLGARDYDPVAGGFLTIDPVRTAGDVAGLNPYTYANNNPITWSDPTGKSNMSISADGGGTVKPELTGPLMPTVTRAPHMPASRQAAPKTPVASATPTAPLALPLVKPTSPPVPTAPKPAPKPPPVVKPSTQIPPAPRAAPTVPAGLGVSESASMHDKWSIARDLELFTGARVFTEAASWTVTGVVWNLEVESGADCRWEGSVSLYVCSGGMSSVLSAQAGTTLGHVFVVKGADPINDPGYWDLLLHEGSHAIQWDTLGPLFAILYLANVKVAIGPSVLTGKNIGCFNFFEWSADWEGGHYDGC